MAFKYVCVCAVCRTGSIFPSYILWQLFVDVVLPLPHCLWLVVASNFRRLGISGLPGGCDGSDLIIFILFGYTAIVSGTGNSVQNQ